MLRVIGRPSGSAHSTGTHSAENIEPETPLLWVARDELGRTGIEPMAVEGLANVPYRVPNTPVDCVLGNTHIPVSFWRSIGSSQNAFCDRELHRRIGARGRWGPLTGSAIAPAITAAIFAATGARVGQLPIRDSDPSGHA
jgi:hypothetical protein